MILKEQLDFRGLPICHAKASPMITPIVKVMISWVAWAKFPPVDRRTWVQGQPGRAQPTAIFVSSTNRHPEADAHVNILKLKDTELIV